MAIADRWNGDLSLVMGHHNNYLIFIDGSWAEFVDGNWRRIK